QVLEFLQFLQKLALVSCPPHDHPDHGLLRLLVVPEDRGFRLLEHLDRRGLVSPTVPGRKQQQDEQTCARQPAQSHHVTIPQIEKGSPEKQIRGLAIVPEYTASSRRPRPPRHLPLSSRVVTRPARGGCSGLLLLRLSCQGKAPT